MTRGKWKCNAKIRHRIDFFFTKLTGKNGEARTNTKILYTLRELSQADVTNVSKIAQTLILELITLVHCSTSETGLSLTHGADYSWRLSRRVETRASGKPTTLK